MQSELINNRERAAQLLAFDGMQYGKCRPTDIDLSMDWQGRYFVFVELKGARKGLTQGQRFHLQALVRAIRAGGKQAIAILANHNTPDTEHDVHVGESTVRMFFDGGPRWVEVKDEITLDLFLQREYDGYMASREQQSDD